MLRSVPISRNMVRRRLTVKEANMGNFKSKLGEGVNKIKENSKEATDIGGEMTEQADQINAILESIDLQDSEDIQAMSDTGNAYQSSFDSAFSEQVETKGAEV